MVNSTIYNYIKENSSMYSKESIETALKGQGYSENDISEAYTEFSKESSNTSSSDSNSNNFEYAGFWIRFVAYLVDAILIGTINSLLLFFIPSLTFLVYLIFPIYFIYLTGTSGQTIGKKLLDIKVVNTSGEVIGIPQSIFRYVMYLVSGFILSIGFIMAAFDEKKRALHDRVVKTYVIKVK